jgi:hypothetical protein
VIELTGSPSLTVQDSRTNPGAVPSFSGLLASAWPHTTAGINAIAPVNQGLGMAHNVPPDTYLSQKNSQRPIA